MRFHWSQKHVQAGVLAACLLASAVTSAQAQNLVTNGNFTSYATYDLPSTTTPANGYEISTEAGTSTDLTGWTSAGYAFIFTPTTNNTGTSGNAGSYSGQYANYLKLYDSSNGGIANSWNGQGPTASTYFIASDGDYENGAITQTINNLSIGGVYSISFQWAGAQQTGFTGATTDGWTVSLGTKSASTGAVANTSQGFTGWMTATFTFEATATSEVLSFLAVGTPAVPPFSLLANVDMTYIPEPTSLTLLAAGAGLLAARRIRRRRTIAA